MFNETMTAKVKELRELRRMQEELADAIETIQDEIKGIMSANDLETLTGADWKITWKTVVSNRLDTTALKKLCPTWPRSTPRPPHAADSSWHEKGPYPIRPSKAVLG